MRYEAPAFAGERISYISAIARQREDAGSELLQRFEALRRGSVHLKVLSATAKPY
ncbi:hypothetical protein NVSP9465_02967 [Novosphingobium sp. CECT 9465]|nr:hypothetical protein NVSP9465_02967 [Novosphingobium sp. CECT 9465]